MLQRLIARLRDNQIDVIIPDPVITCHQIGENDNAAMDRVAKACARIAKEADCSITLIHHTAKPRGDSMAVEHGRGASSCWPWRGLRRAINNMSKSEAEKAKIAEADRRFHFRAEVGKATLMKPAEVTDWHRLVLVNLDNGYTGFAEKEVLGVAFSDEVGVLTALNCPNFDTKPTAYNLRRCLDKIKAGGRWRADPQSQNEAWIGVAAVQELALNPDDKADRAAISKLIKLWVGAGHLEEVPGFDAKRKARKYIVLGKATQPDDGASAGGAQGDDAEG